MKRFISILLTAVLLLSFAACSREKETTTTQTTTATTTVTQTTTQQTSTSESTKKETTAKKPQTSAAKKTNIAYLYNGYWYQNDGNRVLAMKFQKDGSVTVSIYLRQSLVSDADQPDSTVRGSFKNNGDDTLTVYPDKSAPDASELYRVSSDGTLACIKEDPEGSTVQALQHFKALSKKNASSVLFADN